MAIINGTADDDILTGTAGDDQINGLGGNDILEGLAGADVLNGGTGTDTASYENSPAAVTARLWNSTANGSDAEGDSFISIENLIGSAFNDTLVGDDGVNLLQGGDGNDRLYASLGADTLLGGSGNDRLFGGGGDDSLEGGAGADRLDGGAGIDTASYASSSAGVIARLWNNTADGGDAAGDSYFSIENLTGSAFNDTLVGDDGVNVLQGGGGNDRLFASSGNDSLDGGAGDDVLHGGPGGDILDGGTGTDTVSYAESLAGVTARLWNNTSTGGDATGDSYISIENLTGSIFNDTLVGDIASNMLQGGSGNDRIYADSGNDILWGGSGNDRLFGNSGNDILKGGAGGDFLNGGDGVDTASYAGSSAAVTVKLWSNIASGGDAAGDSFTSIENFIGSAFNDLLVGDNGSNFLQGGGGNDRLFGGGGNDRLEGGAGNDNLTGGSGNDVFVFTDNSGNDTVTDFQDTVDRLVFSAPGRTFADLTISAVGNDTLIDDGFGSRITLTSVSPETVTAADFIFTPLISNVAVIELSEIEQGIGGFVINGRAGGSGDPVSGAGDVNGDGYDDLIIGAPGADPNGNQSGASYVVFGKADGAAVELSDVAAGIGGFVINGISADDRSGNSVSGAGDVNGDGLADLIVGARDDDSGGSGITGAAYVILGKADGAVVELSDIRAGIGGFVMNGVGNRTAQSVSGAGDVNGDGLDDLIVGAYFDDPNGLISGTSFVVFGKADGTIVELSDIAMDANAGGFAINGVSAGDRSGISVSSAGDVNGDGLEDLIIGASGDDPHGSFSGAAFVVFGKTDGSIVELSDIQMDANNGGFVINGVSAGDYAGRSVSSAGDVNGDGLDDLIVGALNDDPNGALSGASFVVFGKTDGAAVELSDIVAGIGGFVIRGVSAFDQSGKSVSSVGDINGDGLDDLIVGASGDGPNGDDSGATFIIFGKADGGQVQLRDIQQGIGGFVINGVSDGDGSGRSVSGVGDINGDGFDDLIIGASGDDPNGSGSGASFVVFGGDFTGSVDILGTSGADVLVGTAADEIIIAAQGDDSITGGGGDDRMTGAAGDDTFIFTNGSGNDVIVDFVAGAGSDDVLDISAFGFADLAAVQAASTQVGDDLVIALDGDDSVTLLDVSSGDLHADDFLF